MRKLYVGAVLGFVIITILFNYSCNNAVNKNNVKDAASAQLKRGDYLVNALCNCMHCHADRDFNKFGGPVVTGTEGKGGEEIAKGFFVKNITPSVLGNWSDDEIARAITKGIDKNGDTLYPSMPYGDYMKMTREDVYSIVAYLRTLKPIPDSVPKNQWDSLPAGMLTTLYANFVTKHAKGEIQLPSSDDKVKMGEYLVNAGHCNGCHTPFDGKAMDFNHGMYLAGGSHFTRNTFQVNSANLTPDSATGIGAWSEATFLAKFKSYLDPKSYNYAPGKYNSIMPWTIFCNLKDEDLRDIYAYLRTIKPVNNKVEKWPQ